MSAAGPTLRTINETWNWASTSNNQQMVISNWEWNVRNSKYRSLFENGADAGNHFEHASPIVPILAVIMLTITVFLLILFRQNPGLVAGTVAGCLTIIGIYLTLNTIKENTLTFE